MPDNLNLPAIFKTIVDHSTDHYLVSLPSGEILYLNKSMEAHLGYTSQRLLPTYIYDIVLDNERVKIKNLIETANEHGSSKQNVFFLREDRLPVMLHIQVFINSGLLYFFGNEQQENHLTLQQKYKEEMEKASQIYQRSLPDSLPASENIAFAACYRPAEELGGDIYDVFQVDNGMLNDFFEQYVVLLCDVTGHGLDSAMLSLFAKETVSQYFEHKHSEGQLLSPKEIVDDFVLEYARQKYPEDYFICLFLGIFDMKNNEFIYCTAGYQNAPLLVSKKGMLEELPTGRLPISSALPLEAMCYPEHTIPLVSDMTFLLTTDGMPEQENPEEAYDRRMKETFVANHTRSPVEIVQALHEDFFNFSASQKIIDDVTFIVIQTK